MTITTSTPTVQVELPTEVTATVSIKAKIDRLREVRAIKKSAEDEAKAITAEILDFAGAAKAIKWGKTVLAKIVPATSVRTTDFDTLKAVWPEAYEACVKPGTPYKQVR